MKKSINNPWKCCSKVVAYENSWICVEHHKVITPGGSPGVYGVVKFKNVAVGILPVDQNGNTRLVKQYRYPLQCETYEIPEGGCPVGEYTLDAAKRELKEETGLTADSWNELMQLELSNSVSDEVAVIYVAQGLTSGDSEPEDTEEIETIEISVEDAIQMVYDGKIKDAISVAALLRYDAMGRGER